MKDISSLTTKVPRVYRVNGHGVTPSAGPFAPFSAESYLIMCPEPVLVDCGARLTYDEMKGNLRLLGLSISDIRYVIGTHYHPDHVGNTALIRRESQAEFALHESDVPFLGRGFPSLNIKEDLDASADIVDLKLTDGQVLRIGDVTFEIVPMPGHTPGSCTILAAVDGYRMAFVGDTVHGVYFLDRSRDAYADLETWADSLERLLSFDFDLMFEGHVFPIHILGNILDTEEEERQNMFGWLMNQMESRRRGIENPKEIIRQQWLMTRRKIVIVPEYWITQLAERLGFGG
ncbi:MAG: MBL fold metallo-hydrolase [Chloroflexi bacterium]|nr:MBL fold metallo-hydrolase [Chloroflexota bacterium]MCL5075350.1 MBL fold metallo-hydrolase [Chloroflexota bacterium]